MKKSKIFWYLSKLPLKRIAAIEIDGVRTPCSFLALTKDNIYLNEKTISLDSITDVLAYENFLVLSKSTKLEFRSVKMKLHLCHRTLSPKDYANELLRKYCTAYNALLYLSHKDLDVQYKNEVEKELHKIELNGDIL